MALTSSIFGFHFILMVP